MTNPQQAGSLIGLTAVDAEGAKIGKVGQIYLDDASGEPQWATVNTGLFGTRQSFAPLYNSVVRDGDLVLGVTKEQVKTAPGVEDDGHLDDGEVSALFEHYAGYTGGPAGDYEGRRTEEVVTSGEGYARGRAEGYDTSGPVTDDAMTRSEERLRVGTERVETGRARLRKYIVTENVSQAVPVSHEEVRIEREPITDANRDAALDGPELSEEEHEVTLHAERPVVAKETVPVERVRLSTQTVTEQQQVTEQVRKEQIESVDATEDGRPSGR